MTRYVNFADAAGVYIDVPHETSIEDIQYRLRQLEELGIAKDKVFLNYMEIIADYERAKKEKPKPVPNRAERRKQERLTRRKG